MTLKELGFSEQTITIGGGSIGGLFGVAPEPTIDVTADVNRVMTNNKMYLYPVEIDEFFLSNNRDRSSN
jgi:hypothetical protein